MKESPILFSTPMVKAILDGRKTQTRRVVKPQFDEMWSKIKHPYNVELFTGANDEIGAVSVKCPYGQEKDLLWVREKWAVAECYDALRPSLLSLIPRNVEYAADASGYLGKVRGKWRPSIFMPKKFARIWLEVTDVRVERVQEITEDDSISEGSQIPCDQLPKSCRQGTMTERTQFSRIWDSINGKKHPWKSNPWVWVVEFKKKEI